MIWICSDTETPIQISMTEEEFSSSALVSKGWKRATIEDHRRSAYIRANDGLTNAILNGQLELKCVPGFVVDARRGGRHNDIENAIGKIALIEAGRDTNPLCWVGVSEIRLITLDQLNEIILELYNYGDWAYTHKFTLDYQITNTTSIEELQAIKW